MSEWAKSIFLDALLDSNSSVLVTVDPEGIILCVSHATEKLFGYAHGELIGKPIEILVPERFRSGHVQQRKKFMSDPQARLMGAGRDLYGLRKDGTEFPVEISLNPKSTDKGIFVLATLVDITIRKELTQRYETLVESALVGIYIIHDEQNPRFLYCNPEMARIFGYTTEEIISSKKVSDLIVLHDRQLVAENLRKRFTHQQERRSYSFTGLCKDGKLIEVEVFGSRIELNGKPAIIGTLIDRTEQILSRKRLESAKWRDELLSEAGRVLGESLDYETTLKNVAQIIAPRLADWCVVGLLEKTGSIRLISVVTDPSKAHLVRELETFHPDLNASEGMPKCIRTGQVLLYSKNKNEDFFPHVDHPALVGTPNPKYLQIIRELGLSSYMVVPISIHGKTVGAIGIASSKDDRHYLDSDLETAKELAYRCSLAIEKASLYRDAQAAIQLRDEFLSIASHELKTPLTSLSMQIQMINRLCNQQYFGRAEKEKLAEMARISGQQVWRFTSLINDLLDVSRITAGGLLLDFEEVDLIQLLWDTINRFKVELEKSHCSIEIRGDSRIIGQWDRIRIDQVITNLLTNAMKFGTGKPIEITAHSEGEKAKVIVQDHGIGISEENQARIFDRFERAVSLKQYSGLGLGLFIVRQIVEAHGGSIRVKSQLGHGSSFIVELPLKASGARSC